MASWWWRASYLETCNCAHGCPCNFSMIPTDGTCQAIDAWKIRAGKAGDIRLDGLGLALIVRWPNPIHRGNGRCILFIDDRAHTAQRDALARIGRGEAGEGGPFAIFAGTYAAPPAIELGRFAFEKSEWSAQLRLGDLAYAEFGPIRSDMDGSAANARLVMPGGFIFRDGAVRNTDLCEVKAPGMEFTHRNSSAFFSEVEYNV